MAKKLDGFSPYQRAIAKGHLCSCGTEYRSLDRPIIAVVNSWNEIVPGHAHLRDLAAEVKRGIHDAGGFPLEFNTIAVCDGITQSHNGMKYVLPSRELIADSIEIMINGHGIFDGMVMLGSCDKIVPAMLMAAGRLNIPSAIMTGGPMVNTIKPRQSKAARQQFMRGEIDEQALVDVTLQYYPTPGICPFLGTANTMSIVAEAIGLALPGSGTEPALSDKRRELAYETGRAIMQLVAQDIRPRDIMTQSAFENTLALILAMGGSLNTILHMPAIAAECGQTISMDDFDRISRTTPLITRIYPNSDEYTVADLAPVGGIQTLMRELSPLLDTTVRTVNGKTLAENLTVAQSADGQVIRSLANPFSVEGGIAVLQGNLAPGGAVVKSSAVPTDLWHFTGPARVFECEEDCMRAAELGIIQPGEVLIIRNEGPVGGPGMREMHRATEVMTKIGNVAIITDGRFSGASGGLAIGYLSPEAAAGGPIALVADGDIIEIDIKNRIINWQIDEALCLERQTALQQRVIHSDSNFLRLYSATTLSAAQGAVRKTLKED